MRQGAANEPRGDSPAGFGTHEAEAWLIDNVNQLETSVSDRQGSPISYNAALVLQALAQGHAYGFDVMRVTGLPSGTVYPLLRRLEAAGMVASRWEDSSDAHADARPARRYYEPTSTGASALAAARERLAFQRALFERPVGDRGTS
jgi:DNA-binding MarR family transcriptional regulator